MVSIGKCSSSAATDANTTAISIPGQPARQLCRAKISAAELAPTANAAGLSVGKAWLSTTSFGNSGPGSAPDSVNPPRSFNWLATMVTAIPQVKPTVTACGM
jgi:hypothetical protein